MLLMLLLGCPPECETVGPCEAIGETTLICCKGDNCEYRAGLEATFSCHGIDCTEAAEQAAEFCEP